MAYEEGEDTWVIVTPSPITFKKNIRPTNDLYAWGSTFTNGESGQVWPPRSYIVFNSNQN